MLDLLNEKLFSKMNSYKAVPMIRGQFHNIIFHLCLPPNKTSLRKLTTMAELSSIILSKNFKDVVLDSDKHLQLSYELFK